MISKAYGLAVALSVLAVYTDASPIIFPDDCFSERARDYVAPGTMFKNCLLPSGRVVKKCVCRGGSWVDGSSWTDVFPRRFRPASCYRHSTGKQIAHGQSVSCVRPVGAMCTCRKGRWRVTDLYGPQATYADDDVK